MGMSRADFAAVALTVLSIVSLVVLVRTLEPAVFWVMAGSFAGALVLTTPRRDKEML